GADTLLDAWSIVETRIDLPLVFAGPSHEPWFSEVRERHRGLVNPPRVLGPVADPDAFQRLVEQAAMVVLPYRRSSPASGVLIRAMAAGRAVIVTPVPAARAAVRDGGNAVVVPIDDAPALADALLRLAHGPAERDRLGAAAARTAATVFSWERQLDGLEAAYAAAAGARG
ncbi:MAG: glycosyltransferase, partial [Trebonia sp.]